MDDPRAVRLRDGRTRLQHVVDSLRIRQASACRELGVEIAPCADETTTCGSNGKCESAAVAPDGCPPSQPDCQSDVDAPAGADASLADAAVKPEASVDVDAVASASCVGPMKNHVLATLPLAPAGASATPPIRLASNKTHLFWTEENQAAVLTRVMQLPKTGGAAVAIGQNVGGTVVALAANDTYVWVVTTAGATRIALANGASTPLAKDPGDTIDAVGFGPSSTVYFALTEPDARRRVGGETDGVLFIHDVAIGGDFMAVSATHLFTAEPGRRGHDPRPGGGSGRDRDRRREHLRARSR